MEQRGRPGARKQIDESEIELQETTTVSLEESRQQLSKVEAKKFVEDDEFDIKYTPISLIVSFL